MKSNINKSVIELRTEALVKELDEQGLLSGGSGSVGPQGPIGLTGPKGDTGDQGIAGQDGVDATNQSTGWAQYGDSRVTLGAGIVIPVDTTTIIDIDGQANTIKSQLPVGVTDFYDVTTSKITPAQSGDGYTFTLGFKGTSNSNNGSASIGIDIGGTFGEIFKRSFRFPRGTGISHDFYFTSQGYALGTFLANGGIIKVTSDVGTTTIFNVSLQIHRTHKAR